MYSFFASTLILVVFAQCIIYMASNWCICIANMGFHCTKLSKSTSNSLIYINCYQKLPRLYSSSKRTALNRSQFQARIEWETLPAQNVRSAVCLKHKHGFICFKSQSRWVQKPQNLRKAHDISRNMFDWEKSWCLFQVIFERWASYGEKQVSFFFLLMNVSYDLNSKSEILKAIVAMTGWNMHNIMQDSLFSVTMKKTFFKNLQICFEILDDLKCKNFSWHRYEFSSVYIVFELCSFINANSYAKFSRMHF